MGTKIKLWQYILLVTVPGIALGYYAYLSNPDGYSAPSEAVEKQGLGLVKDHAKQALTTLDPELSADTEIRLLENGRDNLRAIKRDLSPDQREALKLLRNGASVNNPNVSKVMDDLFVTTGKRLLLHEKVKG
ncbi:MAG: hypothetical protein Q7K33_00840 [Candidatus Berkelbacteria bacterium]|nr:hypothetical protein [Candidatus Berkelbacteria bacterium]